MGAAIDLKAETKLSPATIKAIKDAIARYELDRTDHLAPDGGVYLTDDLLTVILTAACKIPS